MSAEDVELVLLLLFGLAGVLRLAWWASHSRRRAVVVSVGIALYVIALVARILHRNE